MVVTIYPIPEWDAYLTKRTRRGVFGRRVSEGLGIEDAPDDRPLVFVSYSHKDEQWKDRLIPHLKTLELAGQVTVWDDRRMGSGGEWYEDIKAAMDRAVVAVILVSADYLSSNFTMREEIPYLLERREKSGLGILPILLRRCAWEAVPWLRRLQMFPRDGKSLVEDYRRDQDRVFVEVARRISGVIEGKWSGNTTDRRAQDTISAQVDLDRLPTTEFEVFGRRSELEWLDHAWEEGRVNVVSLVAWGGVGKSTLVNKWLDGLREDKFRGAARVFGWCFHIGGAGEGVRSADAFFAEALRFFGDPDPMAGSPWAKGERLADLMRRERTLLVLDGLEPLQDPYQGIKDPALQRLIEELARDNAGLCVITTRKPVKELAGVRDETLELNLEQISAEAGRALLRIKGVRGDDAELEQASRGFGNHALAINLLAKWLLAIPGHPIAHAATIPEYPDLPESLRHPRRVMAAFAERFGEGSAEVEVLWLLGLFDRPATKGAIDALRAAPAIPGLTAQLSGLDEIGWLRLLERLRTSGLIASASSHAPDEVDAHPLVREHFGAELRDKNPEAWRAAHARLDEHFKALPGKHQPDTLEEMAPLFQAVFHGCQAGQHQEVIDEVYWTRICRDQQFYVTRKFGASGTDLAVLAAFFDLPWARPVASITQADQAFVLSQASLNLRALGRLVEAVAPMRAALKLDVAIEEWKAAAIRAGNFSELLLTLGEVAEAIARAEQCVAFADRADNDFLRLVTRTILADARHQAGEYGRAENLFEEAERLQAQAKPDNPQLYSLAGYRYCDLLLGLGRHAEVRQRAAQSLEWDSAQGWLLGIALDYLSLGRAELLAYEADGSGDLAKAESRLNQAVDGLRRASQLQELPSGLLARAAHFRLTAHHDRTRRDLEEATRIATRSGMRLLECEAHLEYARLEVAAGNRNAARSHLDRAAGLVAATGYHRRDREVAEMKSALG